jgi:hypothetical protein
MPVYAGDNVGIPYGTVGSELGSSVIHYQYINGTQITWFSTATLGYPVEDCVMPLDPGTECGGNEWPWDLVTASSAMGTNLLETYADSSDPYLGFTMDYPIAPTALQIVGSIAGYDRFYPGAPANSPNVANADVALLSPDIINSYTPCQALDAISVTEYGWDNAWPAPNEYNAGCMGDPDSQMYHTSIFGYPYPANPSVAAFGADPMIAGYTLGQEVGFSDPWGYSNTYRSSGWVQYGDITEVIKAQVAYFEDTFLAGQKASANPVQLTTHFNNDGGQNWPNGYGANYAVLEVESNSQTPMSFSDLTTGAAIHTLFGQWNSPWPGYLPWAGWTPGETCNAYMGTLLPISPSQMGFITSPLGYFQSNANIMGEIQYNTSLFTNPDTNVPVIPGDCVMNYLPNVQSPAGDAARAQTAKLWDALGSTKDPGSLVNILMNAHPAITSVGVRMVNPKPLRAGQTPSQQGISVTYDCTVEKACPSDDEVQNAIDDATDAAVRPLIIRRRTMPDFSKLITVPTKIKFGMPGDAEGYRVVQ